MKRNGLIDYLRFLYAWAVIGFHFYKDTGDHFPGGATGVEFFVLVSGVFFFFGWNRAKAGLTEEQKMYYPLRYLKKRFARFFPAATLAFIPCFILVRVYQPMIEGTLTSESIYLNIARDIWEVLLVNMNGLNNNGAALNSVTWTLSAMLIVEFVICGILVNSEKLFLTLVAPLGIIVGYGYYRHIEEAAVKEWTGFTTFGVVRVFILMCVAYFVSMAINAMKKKEYGPAKKVFFTLLEILCHLLTWNAICFKDVRFLRFESTLLLAVAIAITLSGASYSGKLFPANRFSSFVAEWSFAVFLVHWPVLRVFKLLYPGNKALYAQKIPYAILVLVIGAVFVPVSNLATKLFRRWVGA